MNPLEVSTPLKLHPLPETAHYILSQHVVAPRLLAHLRLVHDVAMRICADLQAADLLPPLDLEAVFFGAAIHDIGKVEVWQELSNSGTQHEQRGVSLLLAQGVSPTLARFCQTHAAWQPAEIGLEDLLVALADTCWKGKRDSKLENRIATALAQQQKQDIWSVWLQLDTIIEHIAADADQRLLWQAQFPILKRQ